MKVMAYTREPLEDAVYAKRLAYSMHLALQGEDGVFNALNHNSGVLFVKATENEDGSLNPKSLKNPWLFSLKEGGFGVFAVRTLAEGEDDTEDLGTAVFWTSRDLVRYQEEGLIKLADGPLREVRCACADSSEGCYRLQWRRSDGKWQEAYLEDFPLGDHRKLPGNLIDEQEVLCGTEAGNPPEECAAVAFGEAAGIQGAVPCSILEISNVLGEYLKKKLMPAEIVSVEVPKELRFSGESTELIERISNDPYLIDAVYSDGTRVKRQVRWQREDLCRISPDRPGRFQLRGRVYQPHFAFPICTDRADPCVCRWKGTYYFIATNDADQNHTLYIRQADSLEKLGEAGEHLILDSTTYEGIGGLLWAPEFHEIDGRLYLFHACTPGPFFCEESHVMALREGGDPLRKEDWSRPRRVVRMDGSELCEAGKEITLDMTEFEWQGELYVIWSQRQFLPKDLGAWLYIAKLDRREPWMLASEPVVLSKPEYGWANNHTFVDEGPFALIRGDRLFVTFSSAAVDSTYVVGLLQTEAGKDPLKRENWRKSNYPLFTSRSLEGEYGTGHNAYVTDENGTVWNTYHARPGIDGPRSSGIRRVHFDIDGEPMLDVTEELDLKEELADVETVVIVEGRR